MRRHLKNERPDYNTTTLSPTPYPSWVDPTPNKQSPADPPSYTDEDFIRFNSNTDEDFDDLDEVELTEEEENNLLPPEEVEELKKVKFTCHHH